MERNSIMDKNIFNDFQQNRQYTEELLDGVDSGVSLFMVSDKIQFLHFNQAADEILGYGKRGLNQATAENPLGIFHPDDVDQLYGEIIATMRGSHYFNYNCKLLRKDGTYQWCNLAADLVQKKEGTLCFYCVISPTEAPMDTLLKGCHFLVAAGVELDRQLLASQIEKMGGTCEIAVSGLEGLDLFTSADHHAYHAVFIGSRLTGMNGFELAKDIRHSAVPAGETIPLILLLTDDDQETTQAAQDIGIDHFLAIPLNQKQVISVLKKLSQE